jgi:molybdate transport system substrate-binding protein
MTPIPGGAVSGQQQQSSTAPRPCRFAGRSIARALGGRYFGRVAWGRSALASRNRGAMNMTLTAIVAAALVVYVLVVAAGCSSSPSGPSSGPSSPGSTALLLYAGSASQPPTEEAIKLFEQRTGITVLADFGSSGTALSQMELTKKGDLYFPGSSDFMEKAKSNGDVFPGTEARVAYVVPAINVQKGNPKGIRSLADLTRPGIKVAMADPESVCVGLYAAEIINKQFTPAQKAAFKANLLNYTASCDKTAAAISLKQVDAVIGWSVFQSWDPQRIQDVPLTASQISRVGYIPIAISKYTKNRAAAQRFIDFLIGPEGQAIFAKHGYFASPKEAFGYIGAKKPVGGQYTLPANWLTP